MTHPTRGPQDHRITMEIFRIQSALQAQGFTIHQQLQPPTHTIYRAKAHQTYQLSFQHSPKPGWTVHPIDDSPTREQIIQILQSVLDPARVAHLEISTLPPGCHPWMLVLLRDQMQRHTVARFRNRQDADDHLRAIRRYMPKGRFEIVFEPPQPDEG